MTKQKTKITLIRRQDKYNPEKIWLIKKYSDGHYALNQEICGFIKNKSYQRTSKARLEEIFAPAEA